MICKEGRRFLFAGIGVFGLFVLISLAAPLIAPFDPYQSTGDPFGRPDRVHWLGSNDMGQDILSELLYGGRISLFIGLIAAFLSISIALVMALFSGFRGGLRDQLVMRLVDVIMSLPFLPFVIVLGAFIGPGISMQILVITLVMWAAPCRELRSQVLKIKHFEFIEAALAMGSSLNAVTRRHVLPELLPLIVPQFIRAAQKAIMMESTLSFLGLGDPILKSWGSILYFANTRAAFLTGAWVNWVLPPGLCITMVVLSLAFIGVAVGNVNGAVYHRWGSFLRHGNRPSLRQSDRMSQDVGKALEIEGLSVKYSRSSEAIHALSKVSFHIHPRSCTGIVGESGCGKSTLVMTIMGLLKFPAEVPEGTVLYGHSDLLCLEEDDMVRIRGREISYVPQNAMNALNPVKTVKEQLIEAVMLRRETPFREAAVKAGKLLKLVEIDPRRGKSYSHQLSGGMRQRVVIALALANDPSILLADEATTGLDVLIQHGIVSLLMDLKERLGLTIFFITHDLPLIASIADHLIVLKDGEIKEEGPTRRVCLHPRHEYTRQLIESFPRIKSDKIWCRAGSGTRKEGQEILRVRNLDKSFSAGSKLIGGETIPVLKDLSFSVHRGDVLGLIGSSGSGKTTLARVIMNLSQQDAGTLEINGSNLRFMSPRQRRMHTSANCHYVFQDPYQSLHGCKSIRDIVSEPLQIRKVPLAETNRRVICALQEVNLPVDTGFLNATPRELSGGQRQRLSFARAVIGSPKLIIADEPASMLDTSLRMELLDLMDRLRERHQTAYLFITHDLALARHFCDRILVLKDGYIVESGTADEVIYDPKHPYTMSLIDAVREPEYLKV